MVLLRALSAAAAFANAALAITLSVTGDAEVGQSISLSWSGTSPWSLDVLTADSSTGDFSLYKNFSPLTVTNAVWIVDVPTDTLVQFEITDATGDSTSQILSITDGTTGTGDGQASSSAASVASTQSIMSTQSELSATSVASVSSVSEASAFSTATAAATTTSPTSDLAQSTDVSSATSAATTRSQSSRIPAVTYTTSSSSSASTSSGTSLPATGSSHSGPSGGAIAGGVIGGILAVMIIAVIAWQCYRRRQYNSTKNYDLEPHPYVQQTDDDNEKGVRGNSYAFSGSSGGIASQGSHHRRTLSRGPNKTVNWSPEEPHLTPNATSNVNGDTVFADRGLQRFSEYIDPPQQPNALNVDLTPPTSAHLQAPAPVMTRTAGPSVLELARGTYNPTSINQPEFYAQEAPLTTPVRYSGGSGSQQHQQGSSPFADKFAVEGKYEPDLQDPAVSASYAAATGGQAALSPAPRPPRPARPSAGIEDVMVARNPSVNTARRMSGVGPSNAGPRFTVGHARKISGPIPIVFPPVPGQTQGHTHTRSTSSTSTAVGLPNWALHMSGTDGGRYPAPEPPMITLQTPTTAASNGSMAGVGTAARSKELGRPIYPAAAMGPRAVGHKRQQSSQQSASGLRSPPSTTRSPPRGVRSPPIVRSPPPMTSPPAAPMDGLPNMVTLPLTPPRRIYADPDVPTTPTTPNLSAFPTPPRPAMMTSASSSSVTSLQQTSSRESASGSNSAYTSPPTSASVQGKTTTSPPPGRTTKLHVLPPPPPPQPLYATHADGLSPIAQSPNIPTPLASSSLSHPSPTLARDNTIASSVIRRELLQTGPTRSNSASSPVSPAVLNPTNYHRPPPPPPIPADVRESWGKKTVSLSSAASGRRWSEREGEEEWKELERQLKWAADATSSDAHVMPSAGKVTVL